VHRLRTFLIAAVVAILSAGAVHLTGALDSVEHDTVDARFGLRADHRPSELVVVAVDDVTFSDLGMQWPFKRSVFAKAVDRLRDAKAKDLVFDIQFTEKTALDEDWALYESLDRFGGGVLATSETDGKGGHIILGGEENLRAIGATGAAANLPDEDSGVVRRFDRDVDGLETIAAVVARRAGRPVDPERFAEGPAWIDFRGGPGTIRTVSFSELYNGRVDPALLRGKIVVIGTSGRAASSCPARRSRPTRSGPPCTTSRCAARPAGPRSSRSSPSASSSRSSLCASARSTPR
jgi:CHASE2 domain-containing sensor protein